jgi:hypothetical protein
MLVLFDGTMLVLFYSSGRTAQFGVRSRFESLTDERRVKDGSSRWNEAWVPDRVNLEAIAGG